MDIKNVVSEIRLSLDEVGKYKELLLTDLPCKIDLSKGKLPISKENQIFIMGSSGYCDVPIETSFDVIYPGRNIYDYVFVKSVLKYVSVNPSYEIDYLPNGYSGLLLLEFPEGIPEILNKLGMSREKEDFAIHDYLWLTQRPILKRILEELDNIKEI
jgi:hypothetical protein